MLVFVRSITVAVDDDGGNDVGGGDVDCGVVVVSVATIVVTGIGVGVGVTSAKCSNLLYLKLLLTMVVLPVVFLG